MLPAIPKEGAAWPATALPACRCLGPLGGKEAFDAMACVYLQHVAADSRTTHSSTTTRSMRCMSELADHSGVGAWSNTPRWPLNSIDVFDATILRPWQLLPAGL